MNQQEAQVIINKLIDEGWLIGVKIFGDESYGLMDQFRMPHVGSDCNRAEHFLMRPKDGLMTQELKEKLSDE